MNDQSVVLRPNHLGTYCHERHFKHNIVNIFHVKRDGIYTQIGLDDIPISESKYESFPGVLGYTKDGEDIIEDVLIVEWQLDILNPVKHV